MERRPSKKTGGRGLHEQAGSEPDGDPTEEEHARSEAGGDPREEQAVDRPDELAVGGDEAHVEVVVGPWLPQARRRRRHPRLT
jgi:hypothetical protein